MRGLTIIGTRAAGDSPGGGDLDCNVLVQNNQGITLDRCTIQAFGHCGVKPLIGDVTITDCIFQDGGFTGRDHGVYISNVGVVTISRSVFRQIAGYGVHIYGVPSGAIIEDCTIAQNSNGGILCGGNGKHQIRRNRITDNMGYGGLVLWKEQSVNNVITDNVIIDNHAYADVVLDHAVAPQNVSGNIVNTLWTNTDYAAWPQEKKIQ